MTTKQERQTMRKGLIHCDLSPLDESERNLEICLADLDTKDDQITSLKNEVSRLKNRISELGF